MASSTPRLRFAPSPTGYLHIGGARTALFNWLYARHNQGTFVLRVEDTDRERSTPESLKAILDGLNWLNIDWDEGPNVGGPHGPYLQSQRVSLYRELAEKLIHNKQAYRCYCSKAELDERRQLFEKLGKPYKYEGTCRERADQPDKPWVIRFRLPENQGAVRFDDHVVGPIKKELEDLYDEVICRQDFLPLYNFGAVADDHAMGITLVGRGQEHINSTFPQILMYQALGYPLPTFAHFPLILGPDREKLSKRLHPEADVMLHKHNGVLPQALLNFIVRLGWSHGNDEVISRAQMIEWFGFDHVGTTSGVWNPEKLLWLNHHYVKTAQPQELESDFLAQLAERGVTTQAGPRTLAIIKSQQERSHTLGEMAELSLYFFKDPETEAKAKAKFLNAETKPALTALREGLASLSAFETTDVEVRFKQVAEKLALGLGKIAQPARVALTGNTVSPPIQDLISLLGKDTVLTRIDRAIASIG